MYNKLIWGFLSDDAFILVNKKIARMVGIYAAILLSDLISKHKYFCQKRGESPWFFNSRDNIEKDTCLSGHQQRHVQKILVVNKLLVIKRKGTPCRNYYLINYRKLHRLLISSSEGFEQLDIQKDEDKRSKRCTTINKNKNNTKNNNIMPVKKPAKKERKKTDKEVHIFNKIFDGFTKINGHTFLPGTESKETKAIWQMIDKAKVSDPDDWEVFLLTILKQYSKLRKQRLEKYKYLWDHPFLPSTINSGGIWPRIVESMKVSQPKIYTEEEILNYASN